MWNKTIHDFGEVKPKQALKFVFQYNGEKKIVHVHPSCGCTAAALAGNSVTVNYEAPAVPSHLKAMGQNTQDFSKTIKVKFDDGTQDVLTIRGLSKSK